jgi:hypothetical protein
MDEDLIKPAMLRDTDCLTRDGWCVPEHIFASTMTMLVFSARLGICRLPQRCHLGQTESTGATDNPI